MGFKKRIVITLIIGVALISIFFLITNAITKYTGYLVFNNKADVEKCLDKQDIMLYMNTEKVSDTLKDVKFINYVEHIKIKNCLRDEKDCLEKEITSFPTWIINNNKIEKEIVPEQFLEYTGCRF